MIILINCNSNVYILLTTSRSSIGIFILNLYLFESNVDTTLFGHILEIWILIKTYETFIRTTIHIHAWLSHGTTASFNGCNDQLIIEQKICPLLTGHLSLRNNRHQIEQQELSIVCDQIGNSFNNYLQFSQHRFALFDLKCFSFFAIQLQQNVMRQYQRFLQCLMVGMSGFGVFHQSWQNQFVTLRWQQFFLTQTKQKTEFPKLTWEIFVPVWWVNCPVIVYPCVREPSLRESEQRPAAQRTWNGSHLWPGSNCSQTLHTFRVRSIWKTI